MAKVAGLALKPAKGLPLELLDSVEVTTQGIVDNIEQPTHRRVTLISKEQWEETVAELGCDLPWQTRRANILVEGLDLGELIGRRVQVGGVTLLINGETEPCTLMNTYYDGLMQALRPDCRGGVYGSVEEEGKIAIGDTVSVVDGSNE